MMETLGLGGSETSIRIENISNIKDFFETTKNMTTMTKKFTRTATETSTNETTEIPVLGVRIKNIYQDLKKYR